MKCLVEMCDRDVFVKWCGLCGAHYERWRTTGDTRPDEPLQIHTLPIEGKALRRRDICPRGHQKTGKERGKACRVCQNLWSALYKIHKTGNRVSARRLYAYGDREHLAACWANRYGVGTDAAYRAADRLRHTIRIQIGTADRWCAALGLHLCLLYPELYMDATVEESA